MSEQLPDDENRLKKLLESLNKVSNDMQNSFKRGTPNMIFKDGKWVKL